MLLFDLFVGCLFWVCVCEFRFFCVFVHRYEPIFICGGKRSGVLFFYCGPFHFVFELSSNLGGASPTTFWELMNDTARGINNVALH